ncbi:trehalose-6-phosphate synthase [Actinidia rufa]|uniref:alpha,alpha-trehalose-phosphate synthase (UDP-forming) n=1 Tax=Actinidia rufa TaxID=165716 RepID=A0A7J0ESY1_9ERIC|nr:trehalose-6-phosphate synthase [Actinidia rufa]
MLGNKYSYFPGTPSTRLERLLRERELRKLNKEVDQCLTDGDNWSSEEEFLQGVAVPRGLGDRCERKERRPPKQRLLLVANRLPVSAVRRGEDSWALEISVGGLVSALLGVNEFEVRWIGWAGVNVPDEIGQRTLTRALAEKRCIPVFLDEEVVHQYYNGYCNNILWPLFHYLGLPQEDRLDTTRNFQSQFDAYKKANQMFADVVNEHYQEGDTVWCHDYHLMFLPKCLKQYNSKMKVGWFLHTPFPSSEIHRTLPSRSELLRSVLAADLVGFHTYDYARHFVSACTRILGLEGTPDGVEDQGKLTRVAAVMLGVDRLDMIKGIPQKILAFEKFLEENGDWRDKVVLLQIAVPTRTDVPDYWAVVLLPKEGTSLGIIHGHFSSNRALLGLWTLSPLLKRIALVEGGGRQARYAQDQKLTCQVHEIVGRINGRFGTLTTVPIHHLDRSLDFYALCALYAVTDVALVTSLRDGMNLVSYEFVACQDSKKGVLILSEFAGAAQSLGAGAILVNPWNITEVAASIGYALNMPADEREKRHNHNFMHVTTHTSQEWAETFVSELNDTIVEAQLRIRQIPPLLPSKFAIEHYLKSNNRLLILGFNATLTQPLDAQGRRGDQLKELELKLHPELKETLKKLCDDPKTTIIIFSGSDRTLLDEHVFEYFTERTPRSYFELRETSLLWNYKYSDVEFGRLQARDMLQHLWTGPISNASLDVVQGARSVEVRAVGVTKGAAIDRILGEIVHNKGMKAPIDYVLCIGHFLAKEGAFLSWQLTQNKRKKKMKGNSFTSLPSEYNVMNVLENNSKENPKGFVEWEF